jgi:hypothetical protein
VALAGIAERARPTRLGQARVPEDIGSGADRQP